MSGLRQRHRARRSEEILKAAHQLFARHGFEGASIEAIARRAEVAPGTIYNYFDTKGVLLLHVAARHFEARADQHWKEFLQEQHDAVDSIVRFVCGIVDWGLEVLDRKLWRSVYATSLLHDSKENAGAFFAMDHFLEAKIKKLIVLLREQGRLKEDTDPDQLGEIVFAVGNNQWLRMLTYDAVSPLEIKQAIELQLHRILSNELSDSSRLKKENEE